MKDDFIVFYEDSELYLGEKEMSAFCQRSSRQLAEAFQSTAIYLDLDLAKGSPLPFFESKINGAKLAYDRLQSELVDRIGEEKTQEIAEQIKVAIKKEKDESAR
jgi:hypothetical protein